MIKDLIIKANTEVSKECDKDIKCSYCRFGKRYNGEMLCFVIYKKYRKIINKQ